MPNNTSDEIAAVSVTKMKERSAAQVDPELRAQTMKELGQLREIPALQSLAKGFMRAATRTDGSLSEVVDTVKKDSALCVRVLRMSNSTMVNPEQPIKDIPTAVQMLGLRKVASLAQALFTMRDGCNMTGGVDWRHLWAHALATAAIAGELERRLQCNASEQLYLAALLHDVGKIVLCTIKPDAYRSVLADVWKDGTCLNQLELKRLGVGHAEAGFIFGCQSGLPEEVTATIAHHADASQAEQHRLTVALVSIANYFSKAYGLGFSGSRWEEDELGSLSAWTVLEEEIGRGADVERIEDEIRSFIYALKPELQAMLKG